MLCKLVSFYSYEIKLIFDVMNFHYIGWTVWLKHKTHTISDLKFLPSLRQVISLMLISSTKQRI